MDPSRNQFFPNSFQGNISNQLNHLNQGSNVNLMQTLSQLSNLANSNLNSTAMGQDMLNRGYLSQNLGNQYLNNGGLNNGVNWNQQQSQDWLDTAKVAAMYNIIQSSVNPTNVNNQFGSPTNFLSTPSSNLFNQPRAELPSVPNSEISMFSNQSSASLTPSMQSSLADNGFGTYNFNPLPSTSASQDLQPALSQQIDADALSEFLDIRSNDFLAGSSSLGNNLQEFNNSTYNQEPLIPKTSFQSAASLSYNNDLPTTYAEPVTQSATSQRNDDPMIGSQHFDQSPYQTNASRTPKQHFEGATTSRFQENTHLFNEDLSNVDLLDLAEKLNKYEEELNAGSDTRQDIGSHDVNNVNSATTYDEYLAASSEQTSHRTDNWSISRLEHDKNVDDQTHRVTESQGEHDQREATHYLPQCVQSCEAVKERPAVEEDPDAMPENFLEEPMERKSSMEMADELSVSVSNAKPQLDSSAVVSATDAKTTSEAQVKSSVPKDDAVVTKEEEVDQTGTALIDFLNGMAGGTERDSPEPMANPSFEPVQFTPPDSPTAPAAPSFQQSAPSFSSFSSFGVLGFTPSTNLGLQPSSSKLVSFLPEIKSETKEPLLSNSMFNVKKNELIKELPKKIPIYKQDMDLKEEKEDKKKAGGNVYDFDEDEFGFDLKPAEPKFKKDEPMSTKPTLPTSVYKPIKPKTQSSNHSKTKPLRIKIRPIEPPPDNTTCIQVLQKELEASSEPIKISPFGDIDISVNPTPKAWRWDSDPNENTKLEVVVKEEDQSERPSLKLTIKMTKKEPTSYFEEPEEKSKKKRKHSESEDEEDEYLPSACRKHKKKKKRRMSFKEIDPLDDLDRVSQCSSSESHPISVRRNSIIDPFKNANLLDDDSKYKYLALERTENNTKGDFVVDKSDLINFDPEDICIWRIEKQVKLKFEPCDEEFSGLYAMTDHYAVWYDEMMSNCVKINCEYISQAKNSAIIRPLYPLAQLFSAIPVDAEECVLVTENGVTNEMEELNNEIFNIVTGSVEIFIKEAVFPGFLESSGRASNLQPLNQLLALKEDVLNNYLERFELLQPLKDKIFSFNRMVTMNENNSFYGSLCENCESDREIVMFHLFNTPKSLLNVMEKVDVEDDEEIDHEDGDVGDFTATSLVLCANCKDPISKIHSIKHCADHLLDECRREIVGMCLNSPTKWQKMVHKEMLSNKIFIEKVSKKYTKLLDSDIE